MAVVGINTQYISKIMLSKKCSQPVGFDSLAQNPVISHFAALIQQTKYALHYLFNDSIVFQSASA